MKNYLKILGIIVTVGLLFLSWFFGFFWIIFYILGLYAALYFISLLFKTTSIIEFILGGGAFILYIGLGVFDLYLLYLVLKFMFTDNFFFGFLLLVFGLPIATTILYFVGMGLGFVLGSPLFWFQEDLEKRFGKKEDISPFPYENIAKENQYTDVDEAVLLEESESEKIDLDKEKKCSHCGIIIKKDLNFCPQCGKKI